MMRWFSASEPSMKTMRSGFVSRADSSTQFSSGVATIFSLRAHPGVAGKAFYFDRVRAAQASGAAWPTGRSVVGTTDRAGRAVWISQVRVYVSRWHLRKFRGAPAEQARGVVLPAPCSPLPAGFRQFGGEILAEFFTSTNAMPFTPLHASHKLPSGVCTILRTTPPPEGITQV